jgi:hypothetical protein
MRSVCCERCARALMIAVRMSRVRPPTVPPMPRRSRSPPSSIEVRRSRERDGSAESHRAGACCAGRSGIDRHKYVGVGPTSNFQETLVACRRDLYGGGLPTPIGRWRLEVLTASSRIWRERYRIRRSRRRETIADSCSAGSFDCWPLIREERLASRFTVAVVRLRDGRGQRH